MTVTREVELSDGLIAMYILSAVIMIALSIIFILITLFKWSSASSAVNMSQYKLRNLYITTLIIAFTASFTYSSLIVFCITNTIIAWDYNQIPDIYEEIMVFALLISGYAVPTCIYISYIQRIQILYAFNKYTNYLLNFLQIIWICGALITSIIVAIDVDGISVGHHNDISSGITLLRPEEKFLGLSSMFWLTPSAVITTIILLFVYYLKIQSLNNLNSNRNELLPILIKECILTMITCILFIIMSISLMINPLHTALLWPTLELIMIICSFLMFNFNNFIFYRLCYFCSFGCLKYCCCQAYIDGDELLLQALMKKHKKMKYGTVNQQDSDIDIE